MMKNLFPEEILQLIHEIESIGFSLCLVGGAVRDYLFCGKIGNDLDFEIRAHSDEYVSDVEWENYYGRLFTYFDQKKVKYTKLPYLITRVDFLGWNLEFSSPRLENFEKEDSFHHHNFKALLSTHIDFQDSFRRRDFTINAIGLKLNGHSYSYEIIDPYNGIDDFKKKILKNIDDNFFKDAVRFLRMIRFVVTLDFKIDKDILLRLDFFNLRELSDYHFSSELLKSKCGLFIDLFRKLVTTYDIELNKKFEIWKSIDLDFKSLKINDREDVLIYSSYFLIEESREIAHFFVLPKNVSKDVFNIASALKYLVSIDKKIVRTVVDSGNENFRLHPLYKAIKILTEKKMWCERFYIIFPKLPELLPFRLELIEQIEISNELLMSQEGPERASYKIFVFLKQWSHIE